MWILYGEEVYLINQEIKWIKKSIGIEPIIFDEHSLLEDILIDISSISIFSNKKIIIIKNHPSFFNDDSEKILNEFLKSKEFVKLVFVNETSKLPKNTIVDFVSKNGTIKEFKKIDLKNISSFIKNTISEKGGEITNRAIIKLSQKLPYDLSIIINEIEKLLLENKNITEDMVDNSVSEYFKDDTFAFINALIDNDFHTLLQIYINKIKLDNDINIIMHQMSSTLSLGLQVFALKKQGLNSQKISEKTKIHIFRIKKILELINNSSIEKIKEIVIKLSDLEEKIKNGKINPELGMDEFILHVIK